MIETEKLRCGDYLMFPANTVSRLIFTRGSRTIFTCVVALSNKTSHCAEVSTIESLFASKELRVTLLNRISLRLTRFRRKRILDAGFTQPFTARFSLAERFLRSFLEPLTKSLGRVGFGSLEAGLACDLDGLCSTFDIV